MISFIIPVYNEEGNIQLLTQKIDRVMKKINKPYEILFVDDGSTDKTFFILKQLHTTHHHVKVIKFKRNFGKSAALNAGFEHAQGDIYITLDGDLQDEPEEIPKFLEAIATCDIVVGRKNPRRDPPLRKFTSAIFNAMLRSITSIPIKDIDCNYRCMRKEVAKDLFLYGDLYRFIPIFAYWKGYTLKEIDVHHNKRMFGKTKFRTGILKLLKGILDIVTIKFLINYKTRPSHFFGVIGAFLLFLGFLGGAYIIYLKYWLDLLIGNRPLLMLSVLLVILGVQFIFFGLLGEMFIHSTQKNITTYKIDQHLK